MKRKMALGLTCVAALCGCGSLGQPTSPSEFRQIIGGSSFGTVESFEAARPYEQVIDTLRKKANECLAVATTSSGTVFQGNTAMRETSHSVYKPTMSGAGESMELAVQVDFGEHTVVQKVPEGGFYILVADVAPAGAKGTKVTIYRGSLGKSKEISAAVRGWATGTSTTCPNLNG